MQPFINTMSSELPEPFRAYRALGNQWKRWQF